MATSQNIEVRTSWAVMGTTYGSGVTGSGPIEATDRW
mgnify:CR=1 FL=1